MAAPAAPAATPIVEHRNIAFEPSQPKVLMDVFVPKADHPVPAVVYFHGGGWRSGDKEFGARYLGWILQRGYALVSVGYRLSSEAVFPGPVEDCRAAVRATREHAVEWGIDPDRLAALGDSSGAHLAAYVAVTSDQVADPHFPGISDHLSAVVGISGPYELSHIAENPSLDDAAAQFLGIPGKDPLASPRWKEASANLQVTKRAPPMLLIHGDKDPVVPYWESEKMARALTEQGVFIELVRVHPANHDLLPVDAKAMFPSREMLNDQIVAFLDFTLGAAAPGANVPAP
jgi:acetyl esterase/lipase